MTPRRYTHPIGRGTPVTQRAGEPSVTGIIHRGTDYGAPIGTPVYCVDEGWVIYVRSDSRSNHTGDWRKGDPGHGGLGNYVTIDHDGGGYSLYAHLAPGSIVVKPAQRVRSGDRLASVGVTGMTTGPHLHFEWRRLPNLNAFIDPEPLFNEGEPAMPNDIEALTDRLNGYNAAAAIANIALAAALAGSNPVEPVEAWIAELRRAVGAKLRAAE